MAEPQAGDIVVVPFQKALHDRDPFESANPKYTAYLKEIASQHGKKGLNALHVAVRHGDPVKMRVFGYFTASMAAITADDMDEELREAFRAELKLPSISKVRIPTLHIGMLSTDKNFEGHGLGQQLIAEAANLAVSLRPSVGCWGLSLDIDEDDEGNMEKLLKWYGNRKFERLRDDRPLMAVSIARLQKALSTPPPK